MNGKNYDLTAEVFPILQEIANDLPGGFFIYQENKNRDVVFVNNALLNLYGCKNMEEFKELTGNSFHGMVHPEDFQKIQHSIDSQVEGVHGKQDHVEYRIITKDGSIRWVDDYGHFTHSQQYGDCYYVFIVDITAQRLALDTRKAFFFNMSHEIITPLNAVSSYLKLAIKHKDDPGLLEEYLADADRATDNLTKLVDNLVEIHRHDGWEQDENPISFYNEDNNKYRILAAEDNEVNQMLLRTILEEAFFKVELVDDGSKAVEAVKNHEKGHYDFVLMDIRMKTMDGYEASRQIRSLPQGGMDILPIYALSANSREEDKAESFKSGMNGHMAKPYNADQIVATICQALRKKQ